MAFVRGVNVGLSGFKGAKGDPGVQGPPGPAGTDVRYTHTQSVPSSTWTVNHNLGKEVVVQVRVGGQIVECEVVHISVNQVTVLLAAPTTGTAIVI